MSLYGKNAVLKIGVKNTAPDTELTKIKDLTVNVSKGEIDVTTRASGGWRENAPGLKEGAIEFDMIAVASGHDDYDAQQTILAAFDNDTVISAFADNGNGKGLLGDFYVIDATESQPLEDAITYSVKLSPCCDDRAPSIVR